jgi:hypothetical protein
LEGDSCGIFGNTVVAFTGKAEKITKSLTHDSLVKIQNTSLDYHLCTYSFGT